MKELSVLVEAAQSGDSDAYDALLRGRMPGKPGAVLAKDALFPCNLFLMFTIEKLHTAGKAETNRNSALMRLALHAPRQDCRRWRAWLRSGKTKGEGGDAMNDELNHDPTRELQAKAVQLGDHDWHMVMEAAIALARAGQAGIAAVLWGLTHTNARVRRGCAGFLDHHATDACFAQLQWVALHDPAAAVRRVAVHSASCQQCKPSPLSGDLVGLLVQVALEDPNRRVREKAIGGLGSQPQDTRAIAALEQILRTETALRL